MPNKILIIDDSEPAHQNYRMSLKRYQCDIVAALSREEGLRKLADHPDLEMIVVDMHMSLSKVSALEFMKTVREKSARIPVLCIITTGKNYSQEAVDLADDRLIKPFTSSELQAAFERLIPQPALPAMIAAAR